MCVNSTGMTAMRLKIVTPMQIALDQPVTKIVAEAPNAGVVDRDHPAVSSFLDGENVFLEANRLLGEKGGEPIEFKIRETIWGKLSSEWKIDDLESVSREVAFSDLQSEVDTILKGKIKGRVVVRVS